MTRRNFLSAFFVFLLAVGGFEQAIALEWDASLTLGEIYTDNVELRSDGLAEDEWITRVSPEINLFHEGSRVELDVNYSLEALYYADVSERNEVYSQLNSIALLDLIGEELRLKGQWGIDQVNVNPDLPLTGSNINTTGNRAEATTWSLGPEWRQTLFGITEVDALYYISEIDYDDPSIQGVESRRGSFVLRSIPEAVHTFTYEAAYSNTRLIYDISPNAEIQSAYLQLGYRFMTDFRLTALGGLDSDYANPTDSSLSEDRWEVGLDAEFGDDLISIGVGERFFGTTYRFSWNRDRDDVTYRVSYREDPSNTDLLRLQIEAPEDGVPLPPDGDLGRPGSANRFIFKRADAGAEWRMFRSTVDITMFWEFREDLTTPGATGDPDRITGDEESYGAVLEFTWDLGTKTIANLGGAWRRREVVRFDVAQSDPSAIDENDLYSLTAGVIYQFGRKTSLLFDVSYDSRVGKSSVTSDYDQFMAELQLIRKF